MLCALLCAGARAAVCGDGVVVPPEECDDGNSVSLDGCSAACVVEAGFGCARPLGPSACTACPPGTTNVYDPLVTVGAFETQHNYSNNADISTTIAVPGGAGRVMFSQCSVSKLEANYDFLTVSDAASGATIAKVSGQCSDACATPTSSAQSSCIPAAGLAFTGASAGVVLRFTSDSSDSFWGLAATVVVQVGDGRYSNCTACATGTYWAGAAAPCSSCAAGRFADAPGALNCSWCHAGSTSSAGSAACAMCERGTFAAQAGSPTCLPCAVGSFSSGTGAAQCESQSCVPGTGTTAVAGGARNATHGCVRCSGLTPVGLGGNASCSAMRCPQGCTCSGTMTDCSWPGGTAAPPSGVPAGIDPATSWLDLSRRNRDDAFSRGWKCDAQRCPRPQNFTLPPGSFDGLPNLETLELSGNQLADGFLPAGLFAFNSRLTTLGLSAAGVTGLHPNVFAPLAALEKLDLSANELAQLPRALLRNQRNLTTL